MGRGGTARVEFEARLTEEMVKRSNIGRRYWGAKIEGIPRSQHRDVIKSYVNDLRGNVKTGWGLFLYGDNSRGKTFAAAAVVKEAMRRGFSAYCILADVLKSIYIDRDMFDSDMSIVERVETVDVLFLDDLGKEYSGKGSGWAELCFENLLRKRNRELRPTIITTNLSIGAFRERYKKSATALAIESMVVVEVKGDDFRKAAAKRKLKEMR